MTSSTREKLKLILVDHLPHPSDDEYEEAVDAIISALPGMVKLEWEKVHFGWVSGHYEVWGDDDDAAVRYNDQLMFSRGGKPAAQAHHSKQIMKELGL